MKKRKKAKSDEHPAAALERVKRHRGVAALILIGGIVVAVGNLFGAVSKLRDFFGPQRPTTLQPVSQPSTVSQLENAVRTTSLELKQAFDAVTIGRTPPIPERDFDRVVGLIKKIEDLDPGNGHVTYYRAFMTRWRDQRPASHDALYWYLERAKDPKLFAPDDNGDARFCFERTEGFCKQRQAFINDVLARDFQQAAREAKEPAVALSHLKTSLGYAQTSIAVYGGFFDPGQGRPTKLLVESLKSQISDAENGTSTTKPRP